MNIKTVLKSSIKTAYPVVVIAATQEDKSLGKKVKCLSDGAQAIATSAQKQGAFVGRNGEQFVSVLEDSSAAKNVLLAGLGKKGKVKAANLQAAVLCAVTKLGQLKVKKAAICVSSFAEGKISIEQAAQIVTETLNILDYKFDKYQEKSKKGDQAQLTDIDLVVSTASEKSQAERGRESGDSVGGGINFARELGDEPANMMTPNIFSERVKKMAAKEGIKYSVLKLADLKKQKMGAILGVAKGSAEPPCMVVLEKKVKGAKKTICIVGKGVTFDSGGISIKPSKDMEKMKYDMQGASAAVSTMKAISKLKLKVNVVAITPLTENLPSSTAQKPGDICTALNGKTIEVINTDAEGRLILADALCYAQKFKPAAIIDLATLTGMCVYTFGDKCIGLMGNDRKLIDRITKTGTATGERTWELPMWDDYFDLIRSNVADIKNVSSGFAGTITAGKFLEQFVGDFPWVHLDIAGTAWIEAPKLLIRKGATGSGVKLLYQLLKEWK